MVIPVVLHDFLTSFSPLPDWNVIIDSYKFKKKAIFRPFPRGDVVIITKNGA
jgi:hypothetical protein